MPREEHDAERWLTAGEFAQHLAVSTSTIRRLVDEGLPHINVGQGGTRGRRFSIERTEPWLEKRKAA